MNVAVPNPVAFVVNPELGSSIASDLPPKGGRISHTIKGHASRRVRRLAGVDRGFSNDRFVGLPSGRQTNNLSFSEAVRSISQASAPMPTQARGWVALLHVAPPQQPVLAAGGFRPTARQMPEQSRT